MRRHSAEYTARALWRHSAPITRLVVFALFVQVATCANVSPIDRPGLRFECPADTEFNPSMNETFPPRAKSCCKVCIRRMLQQLTRTPSQQLRACSTCSAKLATEHMGGSRRLAHS